MAVLCRHLDPLGLSDVWARQFRSWAQTYDEPMLLALIPRVVEQVVKHPRTRTGWAGAILEDWARDGVPAERSEAAAGRVVKSTVAAPDPRGGAPKPLTDFQRKMAAYRAFGNDQPLPESHNAAPRHQTEHQRKMAAVRAFTAGIRAKEAEREAKEGGE